MLCYLLSHIKTYLLELFDHAALEGVSVLDYALEELLQALAIAGRSRHPYTLPKASSLQ